MFKKFAIGLSLLFMLFSGSYLSNQYPEESKHVTGWVSSLWGGGEARYTVKEFQELADEAAEKAKLVTDNVASENSAVGTTSNDVVTEEVITSETAETAPTDSEITAIADAGTGGQSWTGYAGVLACLGLLVMLIGKVAPIVKGAVSNFLTRFDAKKLGTAEELPGNLDSESRHVYDKRQRKVFAANAHAKKAGSQSLNPTNEALAWEMETEDLKAVMRSVAAEQVAATATIAARISSGKKQKRFTALAEQARIESGKRGNSTSTKGFEDKIKKLKVEVGKANSALKTAQEKNRGQRATIESQKSEIVDLETSLAHAENELGRHGLRREG